jgi:hypothetical protein
MYVLFYFIREKLGTPGPESDGNVIGIAVGLTVLFIVLIVLVLLAVIYFRYSIHLSLLKVILPK